MRRQRLRRLLVRSLSMLGEVRERELVPRAARAARIIPRQFDVQRRTLLVHERSLALQTELLATNRQTLAAARRAADAAERIDRRMGGSATPAPSPATAPAPARTPPTVPAPTPTTPTAPAP